MTKGAAVSWSSVFRFADNAIEAIVKAKMQDARLFRQTESVKSDAGEAVQTGAHGPRSLRPAVVQMGLNRNHGFKKFIFRNGGGFKAVSVRIPVGQTRIPGQSSFQQFGCGEFVQRQLRTDLLCHFHGFCHAKIERLGRGLGTHHEQDCPPKM